MALPNIPAKTFSFSAIVIGYLLIDDLTANEQNALGNWLMLVAQVLCTNAYYLQVQEERQNKKLNTELNTKQTIEMLVKMINALSKEVEDLKEHLS